MKRHALIAAALLALAARATTASAAVATSPSGDPTSGVALLVAVCADGSEWMALAPQAAPSLVVPFDVVDPATPAPPVECVALPAWPLPGGTVVPDPTGVSAQDAAVWSRGAQPVVRASDEP